MRQTFLGLVAYATTSSVSAPGCDSEVCCPAMASEDIVFNANLLLSTPGTTFSLTSFGTLTQAISEAGGKRDLSHHTTCK